MIQPRVLHLKTFYEIKIKYRKLHRVKRKSLNRKRKNVFNSTDEIINALAFVFFFLFYLYASVTLQFFICALYLSVQTSEETTNLVLF